MPKTNSLGKHGGSAAVAYRENVNLRRMPEGLWLRLRLEAVRRHVGMNTIVAAALEAWLQANEGKES